MWSAFFSPSLALSLDEVIRCDYDSGEEFSSLIDGVAGKGGWFDGKSYLKPFEAKIHVPETFTFHIWVKPEAYIGGYQGICGFVGRLLLNSNGMLIYQVDGKTLKSLYRLNSYEWSLITVCYDGTTISLYINAYLHTTTDVTPKWQKCQLWLGKSQYFYLGGIDEVGSWKTLRKIGV